MPNNRTFLLFLGVVYLTVISQLCALLVGSSLPFQGIYLESTARVSDAPSATVAFVLERSLCFRRFIRGFGSLVFFKELPRFYYMLIFWTNLVANFMLVVFCYIVGQNQVFSELSIKPGCLLMQIAPRDASWDQ